MMMGSSSKKLSEIIGKWRKRNKGHFVVYAEGKRFVVPLYYLKHPISRVLLEMADEEFGPTVDGPLRVPCEKEMMDYILLLLRKNPPVEVQKALVSLTACCREASIPTFSPASIPHDQLNNGNIVL